MPVVEAIKSPWPEWMKGALTAAAGGFVEHPHGVENLAAAQFADPAGHRFR